MEKKENNPTRHSVHFTFYKFVEQLPLNSIMEKPENRKIWESEIRKMDETGEGKFEEKISNLNLICCYLNYAQR